MDNADAVDRGRATALALLDANGAATPTRVAVLGVLSSSEESLPAGPIANRLAGAVGTLAVYAALHWLVAAGLADRVTSRSGGWHFHARRPGTGVFECEACGTLRLLPMATPAIALPAGFAAEHARYHVIGTCMRCA